MPVIEAGTFRGTALPRAEARAAACAATVSAAPAPLPGPPGADLGAVLKPVLATLCRTTGANAATVTALADDGAAMEGIAAWGFGEADAEPARALARWCRACDGPGATGACLQRAGGELTLQQPASVLGPVCAHIIAVPLKHREQPVGTLTLFFETERALPAEAGPLLQTAGDLLGITLENARLARENLRISLTTERHLMANEVHDSLAQGLTYMRMRMSLLRDAVRADDQVRAMRYWGDVDEALGGSQRRLRELITYFRSRMDPHGLQHALAEIATGFTDRTGIALEFANEAPDLALQPEHEIEVFHIVQEALANVYRHAHARRIRLHLRRAGGECVLSVTDDGVGIGAYPQQPGLDSGHYGIAIMAERARRLGGSLAIESAEPGTRLLLRFPDRPPLPECLP